MRVRDPKVAAGALIQQSNWFTGIETPDKYTAILVSEQPRPAVFDFFEFFNIVDTETVEGPDRDQKLVGTGPFVQTEWVQGDHLTFKRNQNYWQKGQAVPRRDPRHHLPGPAGAGRAARSGRDRRRRRARADRLRAPARATRSTARCTVPASTNVFGSNVDQAADRQQAGAPGAELRDRPQAHRRHRVPRRERAAHAAVAADLAGVRREQSNALRVRPRQGQERCSPRPASRTSSSTSRTNTSTAE